MRTPVATYRLQLHDGFTLNDARDLVPFLARIGISDLYLSPIFEARAGSTHGYDVTDPQRVRASLGGESALRALAAAARAHDMGIILDIVPNHMAASVENAWWRDMLARGRESPYASFFDVDWESTGRIMLPMLGDQPAVLIERGEFAIDRAAAELVHHDLRLPLAAGSCDDLPDDAIAAVRAVLDRQHYELAYWRVASERMNYRRFFDIADLAGVRVEAPHVFDATHALVRRLAADGTIHGLRIDHIDGLRDPHGYLEQLRRSVRGPDGRPLFTVVEKILARDERLPDDWSCEGTTGYEFLSLATGLLLEPDGHARIEAFYQRITGDPSGFGETVRNRKLLVMQRLFGGELVALAETLAPLIGRSVDASRIVVREVTAGMHVYRTYIRSAAVRDEDRRRIEEAVRDALHRVAAPPGDILALRAVLLTEQPTAARALDWIMRWQQFTGPVMAKGFEDTALYCHNALIAANDVGSDPARPCLTMPQLHLALADRARDHARSLNATATHDTKRGEDTRARIAVLSEVPEEWRGRLRRWMREGDEWKAAITDDEDRVLEDADVDSLLYQTIIGIWPPTGSDEELTTRIREYMTKALREAREHTSWRRPDEEYEQALLRFVEELVGAVGRQDLPDELAAFARRLAPHGALNSLAQLLLKVTAPGIPDIYQGTELWSFVLVDPDNRRPVDYAVRSAALDDVSPFLEAPDPAFVESLLRDWEDGRIKLYMTAAALRARRRNITAFEDGDLVPVPALGPAADHLLAYMRRGRDDDVVVALPRWTVRIGGAGTCIDAAAWRDTRLALPDDAAGPWRGVFTGERFEASADEDGAVVLGVGSLFAAVPFALLERP